MRVEGVRYSDGELHIKCSPRDGVNATYKIEVGKEYDIVPHKEKRSLTANAYAWVLIHKIALQVGISPLEVYRQAIKDSGGVVATVVCMKDIAAPAFIRSWEEDHIGRACEQHPSDVPGYVDVICIYGSSDFSRAEMARFIDKLVQDAQNIGIETMQENKLESLLNSWKQ